MRVYVCSVARRVCGREGVFVWVWCVRMLCGCGVWRGRAYGLCWLRLIFQWQCVCDPMGEIFMWVWLYDTCADRALSLYPCDHLFSSNWPECVIMCLWVEVLYVGSTTVSIHICTCTLKHTPWHCTYDPPMYISAHSHISHVTHHTLHITHNLVKKHFTYMYLHLTNF